jgi:hypothetical protein
MQQSCNLAMQQSCNLATLQCNAAITQPCDATITQPCDATITQPCNATNTQLCNATITQLCNATITQLCNETVTQPRNATITQPQDFKSHVFCFAGLTGNDIELELVYPKSVKTNYFYLDGKQLRLKEPLDRDKDDLSSIQLEVVCTVLDTGKRKTIPLIVTISDINDNKPKFTNLPYVVTISEVYKRKKRN